MGPALTALRSLAVLAGLIAIACDGGAPAGSGDPGGGDTGTTAGDPGPNGGDTFTAPGDSFDPCAAFIDADLTIPMRDSTPTTPRELAAFVRHTGGAGCQQPAILIQTPYGRDNAKTVYFPATYDPTNPAPLPNPLFENRAYAVVIVDWRGYHGSAGVTYDSLLPPLAEDGHDTVEWIAAQSWSDGKVGTWGASALCRQQLATAAGKGATLATLNTTDPPPSLAAMVPIFCEPEVAQTYPTAYPGGVLREEFVATLSLYFGAILRDMLLHPRPDTWWNNRAGRIDLGAIAVPVLSLGGWFDLYTPGNLQTFFGAQAGPAGTSQRLLLGPYIHFATASQGFGRAFDAEEVAFNDVEREIQSESLAFFDWHLRGVTTAAATWPAVRYRRAGQTGWQSAASWPPPGIAPVDYWLHADGSLAGAASAAAQLDFATNPDDPSPTVGGANLWPGIPVPGNNDPADALWVGVRYGPRNQQPVLDHIADGSLTGGVPQGRVFVTAPLGAPVRITGRVSVVLTVATTALDTDLAVRLTDVDTAGTHLLIGEGVARLRYRDGLGAPTLAVPGTPYDVTVEVINDLAHEFAAGHRVGLILTGSNYPRFARNPHSGDDFYPEDYYYLVLRPGVPAENALRTLLDTTVPQQAVTTVYLDASHLVLPVAP